MSELAKFGLREKTLQDTKVRNSYEIPAAKITAQIDKTMLDQMLVEIQTELGLSDRTQISAHLHNMLIYEPGQFFKTHQDSEKINGMFATLVIVLPSPHIGCDLVIQHNKQQHRFVSENLNIKTLQCISFYADCHHEVEVVKQGYRVALTFNLVAKVKGSLQSQNNFKNPVLEAALNDYFDIDQPASSTPITMAYFLDHEYSEQGLAWETLKGSDTNNSFALLNAAKHLGLNAHLALVELHESWSTDDYHDENDDDENLVELIDHSANFSYWLDEKNNQLPYKCFMPTVDEICWTTDTKEFEPTETEREGWMGNYGNTVDYWYRRAAVVLWRNKDQIAMEFQLNYDAALENILNLIQKPRQTKKALTIVKKAGNHIPIGLENANLHLNHHRS